MLLLHSWDYYKSLCGSTNRMQWRAKRLYSYFPQLMVIVLQCILEFTESCRILKTAEPEIRLSIRNMDDIIKFFFITITLLLYYDYYIANNTHTHWRSKRKLSVKYCVLWIIRVKIITRIQNADKTIIIPKLNFKFYLQIHHNKTTKGNYSIGQLTRQTQFIRPPTYKVMDSILVPFRMHPITKTTTTIAVSLGKIIGDILRTTAA